MNNTAAIILAGGLARRMGGGDKGLETLGSAPILEHVINRIAPQVDMLALNANGDPARFAAFNLPVLADSIEGFVGPLAGILAGMDWAASQGLDHVISVAADTPFFPTDLVTELTKSAKRNNVPIAIAATPDTKRGLIRQPVFGLWSVDLRENLRAALNAGTRKIIVWAEEQGVTLTPFQTDSATLQDPFFNINTPEDLAKARLLLEQ